MRKLSISLLLSAALAAPLAAHAQDADSAPPVDESAAEENGTASQGYEDFTPTEEISEDLSVAFPTDI